MNRQGDLLLSLIAPPPHQCHLCDREALLGEDGLCDSCRKELRLAISPPVPPHLDGFSAGLAYTPELGTVFYRFKAKEERYLAPFLAQYITIPAQWQAQLLLPVPLHPLREYLRTYNQSFLLAEYVSSLYRIPISRELLFRTRPTSQQKKLNARQRSKNVKNAFEASPLCAGYSLVLIDDVVTTGTTMSECARVLKKAGAHRVYGACAACVGK